MIWLSWGKWKFSKFREIFGGYMMAIRYTPNGKWTPIVFLRWKSYGHGDNITWSEIKEVCTSLDNVFYGAMVLAVGGLLYWFWMMMNLWLIGVPIGYVLLCYLGRYVKNYINRKRRAERAIDSFPGPSI